MIKIGITGGIGSGKSLVCQIFYILGIPVYYADEEAKKLMISDPDVRKELVELAGTEVYIETGLNRPFLADLIFNNKAMLEKLNRIIHPRIAEHFKKWCLLYTGSPYIIHESAILFESGLSEEFDKIIAVAAPEPIRINRVLSRSNMDRMKIIAIIKNQLPEDDVTKRSDYIINNDDLTLVIPQVLDLHKKFLFLNYR